MITDQDGHSCLKSVESYDPSTNQWRKVPDLANAKMVAVAATVDVWGKIIVFGGFYDMNGFPSAVVEQTCEVFDPCLNQWSLLPSPKCSTSSMWNCVWMTVCMFLEDTMEILAYCPG